MMFIKCKFSFLTIKTLFLIALFPLAFVSVGQGGEKHNRIRLEEYPSITLVSGVTHTVHLGFFPSIVSVGDQSIADYVVIPKQKQIQIVPKKVGNTDLVVRDSDGVIRKKLVIFVTRNDLSKTIKELQMLLGHIEGIEIRIVGNKVVVDGELLLPSDLSRVVAVMNQFDSKEVALIATLSPVAQKILSEKIEKDISSPEVHVRAINGHFLIEGVVDSEADAIRAVEIAKTYLPDAFISYGKKGGALETPQGILAVINLLKTRPKAPPAPGKTIKIDAYYVELSKDFLKSFAFQWTPGLQDNSRFEVSSFPERLAGAISGTISNLLPKLNRAKEHGHARILKTTSILIKDGKEGTIRNELKVPYTALGRRGETGTRFASVGLATTIQPTLLPGGNAEEINLAVNFILNALISVNQAGQPAISSNAVATEIVVRSTESAAIAGVVNNSLSSDFNRLPAVIRGSGDPIFTLLRSKAFRHQKSQFVIFLHPQILPSSSYGAEDLKAKFRLRSNSNGGK